jgi:hypothetical protein
VLVSYIINEVVGQLLEVEDGSVRHGWNLDYSPNEAEKTVAKMLKIEILLDEALEITRLRCERHIYYPEGTPAYSSESRRTAELAEA